MPNCLIIMIYSYYSFRNFWITNSPNFFIYYLIKNQQYSYSLKKCCFSKKKFYPTLSKFSKHTNKTLALPLILSMQNVIQKNITFTLRCAIVNKKKTHSFDSSFDKTTSIFLAILIRAPVLQSPKTFHWCCVVCV